MFHAGIIIKEELQKRGKTVTWFAEKMCCTRTHAHKIFRKQHLDTDILLRASLVLECNLFAIIAQKISS